MKKRNIIENFFRNLKSRWTMRKVDSGGFLDSVNSVVVREYEDCFGERWLAESNFTFFDFRIRKSI